MTTKITLEDREKALTRCKYCARREPHIHYYVVTKTKKFKTFGDCLIHTREEMVRFADAGPAQDFYSMNGGMSRKEFLHPSNVRRSANRVWEQDDFKLSAQTVTCYNLMDDTVTEIVTKENFKGFIKT